MIKVPFTRDTRYNIMSTCRKVLRTEKELEWFVLNPKYLDDTDFQAVDSMPYMFRDLTSEEQLMLEQTNNELEYQQARRRIIRGRYNAKVLLCPDVVYAPEDGLILHGEGKLLIFLYPLLVFKFGYFLGLVDHIYQPEIDPKLLFVDYPDTLLTRGLMGPPPPPPPPQQRAKRPRYEYSEYEDVSITIDQVDKAVEVIKGFFSKTLFDDFKVRIDKKNDLPTVEKPYSFASAKRHYQDRRDMLETNTLKLCPEIFGAGVSTIVCYKKCNANVGKCISLLFFFLFYIRCIYIFFYFQRT